MITCKATRMCTCTDALNMGMPDNGGNRFSVKLEIYHLFKCLTKHENIFSIFIVLENYKINQIEYFLQ